MIEPELVNFIRQIPDVQTVVGENVFPQIAATDAPYVVFERTGANHNQTLRGASGLVQSQYRIMAVGLSHKQARELGEALRVGMDGFRGFMGDVFVQRLMLTGGDEDQIEASEGNDQLRRHMAMYEMSVDYEEAVPVHSSV